MKKFTTRVELHDANAKDYEALHAAMETRKFFRAILSSDGRKYQLPTAEYDSFGDITAAEVRDLAATAAASTDRSFWILVTEAGDRAWTLREITPVASR